MKAESKTIIHKDGRVLLFSVEDFYYKIVKGNDCFICGATGNSKTFNKEHVLPDWLLTKYQLHSKTLNLPNGATLQYGRYTVSCCVDCNTLLGNTIEIPVSSLLKLSYSEICKLITANYSNLLLLFNWTMLLFFKLHLKDKDFRWNLDGRKGDEKISDIYAWEEMHHIHCMIRAIYTKAVIDYTTIGSIIILPALSHSSIEPFDFADNAEGKAIMIRLDEFCIICVLNDSWGTYSLFADDIRKIKGALSPFQLREIFSHIVYINSNLQERPLFYSRFFKNGEYHIIGEVPDTVQLVDEDLRNETFGEIMYYYCKDLVEDKAILQQIKNGAYTYLVNSDGNFIDYSESLKS